MCLFTPEPVLQILSAIKPHPLLPALRLPLLSQALGKGQAGATVGTAGSHIPCSMTCWVLFVRLVGVCCRCVLAQTAALYSLIVLVALLGIWGDNLASNPLLWELNYTQIHAKEKKNLPPEQPGFRTASMGDSCCPWAPCQLSPARKGRRKLCSLKQTLW